jgi:hypothetical protein
LELEKLPSHPNLYRLRAPIEWEVDLLDFHLKCVKECERVEQADSELESIFSASIETRLTSPTPMYFIKNTVIVITKKSRERERSNFSHNTLIF